VEVTMKVLEALAAAIAAEGIDRIFAVIGDANQ
jgi:thiamine pyrophosphate-dependent acetolactate synthase large subunit-like protein